MLINGRHAVLHREPDIDAVNRGWQTDQVRMEIDGETVGLFRICYIPRAKFRQFYPSILFYLEQLKGHCLLGYNPDGPPHMVASDVLLDRLYTHFSFLPKADTAHERLRDLDPGCPRLTEILTRRYRADFADFERYHVNRPLADYVTVYTDQDFYNIWPGPGGQRVRTTRVPTDWQNLGIEAALMKEGAIWMAELGMKLYFCHSAYECRGFSFYKNGWDALPEMGLPYQSQRSVYDRRRATGRKGYTRVPRVFVDARPLLKTRPSHTKA